MIILTETTDKIQAVLAGAITTNQLRLVSSWRDITTTAYTPGRTVANTNGVTDVDIVPAPAASTQRVCDFLSVYNSDTANAVVTIKFDANGTEYEIWKGTLGVGERLEYQDGQGFRIFANNGSIKTTYSNGSQATSSSLQTVVLASDQTNNNAVANTIQDVTGLSFGVTSGLLYYFRFVIQYTAAATTTGSRWTINGPAITELRYRSRYSLTATSQTLNEGLSAYDSPAASSASSAATGSNVAIIEGFIKPGADGTVIARFASEVASSAIVAKAGSIVQFQAVA